MSTFLLLSLVANFALKVFGYVYVQVFGYVYVQASRSTMCTPIDFVNQLGTPVNEGAAHCQVTYCIGYC